MFGSQFFSSFNNNGDTTMMQTELEIVFDTNFNSILSYLPLYLCYNYIAWLLARCNETTFAAIVAYFANEL